MKTAVILMGIPGSGKSTFYRERFFTTHVRINLDMLKTRHREKLLLEACVAGGQPFVADNTNATRESRARYILPARTHGFRVIGYYFRSEIAGALERNRKRRGGERIPDKAILGIAAKLELPHRSEGFDELWYVRLGPAEGTFTVEEWRED